MSNDWNGTGYDAPAQDASSGVYFRLKTKGQTARLRLVSDVYRFMDTLEADGKSKLLRKCAWVAILKELVDGKPVKRVVCFQAGPMVYGLIKDLAESPDWGDPTLYDITVTRTETKGAYYTVHGVPKGMGVAISKEEQELVSEANLNLVELCSGRTTESEPHDESSFDPFAGE